MCLDKNLLIASSLLYFLGNRPYDTKVLQNKKKKKNVSKGSSKIYNLYRKSVGSLIY